ncbi:MAG: phosphopentomutase [Bacteroidota bacterium]
MTYGKLICIVLDGVGIGALPDADAYGDVGTNTIANTARAVGGLKLPTLERLGLGNIADIDGVRRVQAAEGCYGKMQERSKGKDSTTGHWELAGVITDRAFPTYPQGFPESLLETFLSLTGCKGYLGNKPASGTEIIKELGDEHVHTGFPIVYTSGDSVFQIAAHEETIPLPELYRMCRIAREQVLVDEHKVGRVIARPFIGATGGYSRTPHRKDFAVEPGAPTVFDLLSERGVDTVGVGKIDDLFSGRGLKEKIHTKSNANGIEETIRIAQRMKSGFLMTNLVDFDQLYGHRQNPEGLAEALEAFDKELPRILDCLNMTDLLMMTADHGNDPTDRSTDHSREYVPIVCYSKSGKQNVALGVRQSFADAGKTVAEYFGMTATPTLAGTSFLKMIFS